MKRLYGIGAAALLALAPAIASATVQVDATDDIFLASQPNGSIVTGYFGSDDAPDNSPVDIGASSLPK